MLIYTCKIRRYYLQMIILLLLILNLYFNTTKAQQWTEPVNISNINDMVLSCDFTIDNIGVIHCVWSVKYDANLGKIYYNYSLDDGETWSETEDVSANDEYYCVHPQIRHNSVNEIIVTYDLNDYSKNRWGSYIMYTKKDTSGWTTPLNISEGLGNKLVIDNNDRLYVFWFMRSPAYGEFYYKYLENGIWSELFCPYFANWKIGVNAVVVDTLNNLHCTGYYSNHDSGLFDNHTVYFKYNLSNNSWSNLTDFSVYNSVHGNDVALDTYQLPHICWQEYKGSATNNSGTFYSYYNGTNWSDREELIEDNPRYQSIDVDNYNYAHIINSEYNEIGCKLMYYYKPVATIWDSMLIDECENVIFTPKDVVYQNKLYVVYTRSDTPPEADVYISRLELTTTIEENLKKYQKIDLEQNYPNPFNKFTSIQFSIPQKTKVDLYIYDVKGRFINCLLNKPLESGCYTINWDGTDSYNRIVDNGLYIYVFQTETKKLAKILSFIKH